MLQTKKINKDVVAVAFDPSEILLRKSGKEFFGKEEFLVRIRGNKVIVDAAVANKFGLTIETQLTDGSI